MPFTEGWAMLAPNIEFAADELASVRATAAVRNGMSMRPLCRTAVLGRAADRHGQVPETFAGVAHRFTRLTTRSS